MPNEGQAALKRGHEKTPSDRIATAFGKLHRANARRRAFALIKATAGLLVSIAVIAIAAGGAYLFP